MSEPAAFEGFIVPQDGAPVIVIRGDVDILSTEPLGALIDQALDDSPHIIFDVGDVTFLDSSGLRAIMTAYQRVNGTGSITIRHLTPPVAKVLEISGVKDVLTVEP